MMELDQKADNLYYAGIDEEEVRALVKRGFLKELI